MFWDDVVLVTETFQKYGVQLPIADLGGQANPVLADYDLLPASPFIQLKQRPLDHIDPQYLIFNPERGDPPIEEMEGYAFGVIVCVSVLEHVSNPFAVLEGLARNLREGGLLILSTVFAFRYHPAPQDYWRFTPDALRLLAESAGLTVLDVGFRVRALLVQGDAYNLVRSVYLVASKGEVRRGDVLETTLPARYQNGVRV